MPDTYLIPKLQAGEIHRTEITIKRSRFITSIGHTRGSEEARDFIKKISSEFSDARHNCFAYNGSKPGETGYAGCSDDGEPHGTAGQPMLNIILHSDIGEITAVVTRYFGGILLGTGGLVKAYQESVKKALQSLPTEPMRLRKNFAVLLAPKFTSQFLKLAEQSDAQILSRKFTDKCEFIVAVPKDQEERFTGQTGALRAQIRSL